VTATTGVQADHRELLLQAYAAYNSQDVEALVALISDDVDWPELRGSDQGISSVQGTQRQLGVDAAPFVSRQSFRDA
jgi:hypothetical protein